jgi:hypothetical protein
MSCFALLGWSLPVIESAQKLGKPFVVVSYPAFESYAKEHDIPFVGWDFDSWGDQSNSLLLSEQLKSYGVTVAVPLFEETVEWAGALNSIFRNDPRLLNRAMLFRNKAMMKRKALIEGLRVGLFEEVHNRDDVRRFAERLNEAQLRLPEDPSEESGWIHIKPFAAAGTVGHRLLRSKEDIEKKVEDGDFPCLAESHLKGREFSCEAFIHNGKIRFLNITEYVRLGYSNFVPCSSQLEKWRPQVMDAMQRLVKAFGIEYGMIHPEWFIDDEGVLSFGEVAARIPGGHILELVSKAYDMDILQAYLLCHDPATTEEELAAHLPKEGQKAARYAGSLMVYPDRGQISRLEMPEELLEHSYFDHHTLVPPMQGQKVAEREGYGNHFGTIFFQGDDSEEMRKLLQHYENVAFYV